jgi:hypothetical protein
MSLKDLSSSLGVKKGFNKNEKVVSQDKPKSDKPFDTHAQIKTIPSYKLMAVQMPDAFTDDINNHIDNVVIPSKVSHKGQLVGQINRDEKSEQYTFSLDDEIGKDFKLVIDRCATSLLRDPTGYKRDSIAEAFEAWTVHSYAGDYNPLHSHGCHTPSGLSMIFYLKVPKCIEEKPSFPTLHNATGDIDGHTGLITSTNTIADVYRLKLDAQEYIKPKKGFMIIFPNWLQHCVMPFFGEGERRTMSANFNIRDSKETVAQFKSPTLTRQH